MLSQFSENKIHQVRWVLTIGWLILIFSLFYDPISYILTEPNNSISPFSLSQKVFTSEECIKVQQECLVEHPYPIGARIWWTIIVPSSITIIFVLGHEFWRRICPLSFISQIPKALGIQRKIKLANSRTRKISYKTVVIQENSWLGKNHLYLQFSLFVLGLFTRIIFINSNRIILGIFLIVTILSALTIGYLYTGKSWCNYFCPMGIVQMVYTGPRGIFGTKAHQEPKLKITQSMCRTVNDQGQEVSACDGCKSFCLDIDAERSYWGELKKPGRRLIQYGYLGMVFAYYFYYYFYAGNWDYYFSGAWTHEENQLDKIFSPGFYIFEQPIPIPKYLAVILTFSFCIGISYLLCYGLEKAYKAYRKSCKQSISEEQAQHTIFTFSTFVAFCIFFPIGSHLSISLLPKLGFIGFKTIILSVSSIWLYRTLKRSRERYNRERLTGSLRQQLKKMNLDFSQFLQGRSLEELNPDELYILAKVLPSATQQDRKRFYVSVVREELEVNRVNVVDSTKIFKPLRQELGLSEATHHEILNQFLNETKPDNKTLAKVWDLKSGI